MSSASSPAQSPPAMSSPPLNPNHTSLPPIITSPPTRRSTLQRPLSHASKNRLSQYSTGSLTSRSRPVSFVFPAFPSSLPYTLVRDFAYPMMHPMHYGPPPESSRPASGLNTPSESQRRLSDPQPSWDSKMNWDTGSWAADSTELGLDFPPMQFADGPPWSEDEDLQSPVVSSRHRKHKSEAPRGTGGASSRLNPDSYDLEPKQYRAKGGDGPERYYINHGSEANGPGGEYVTYPPGMARHSNAQYNMASQQQPRQYAARDPYQSESDESDSASSPAFPHDDSRYSRDYQFTITSPDEEMHGKAVALYDFARENENELPLVEGQIIWVSYRHGQGWLVAEDPKTQESGLVPEEYVRLLRDIEGGMNSLTGNLGDGSGSPNDVGTPTQAEPVSYGHTPTSSTASTSNGYHQPIVSTFSTSSKDLNPYPQHLLGMQAGQVPPQVVHYHGQRGGSQANTPTLSQHHETDLLQRNSQDGPKKTDSGSNIVYPVLETLPDAKLESPSDPDTPQTAEEGRRRGSTADTDR